MDYSALISVVIPSYGRAEFLGRAIQSVTAQTYSRVQIIVVDDNGAGTRNQLSTKDVVEESLHDGCLYIANEHNKGGAYSRNVGVSAAEGEFVAFLDDDDEWTPEFLERGIRQIELANADVVYCDCWNVLNGNKEKAKLEISEKHSDNIWVHLLEGWCPSSTSLFLLKRELSATGDLFDSALNSFQDYDCWLSLAKRARFTFHNEPSVYKHLHQLQQITTNTAVRRDTLAVLERKWLPKLKPGSETDAFKKTLKKLGGAVDLTEFRYHVKNASYKVALSFGVKYLKAERFSVGSVYALLKQVYLLFR